MPTRWSSGNAMRVWESDGTLQLLDLLKADPEVTHWLAADRIEALFDLGYHFKHVDTIFARVFGDPGAGPLSIHHARDRWPFVPATAG